MGRRYWLSWTYLQPAKMIFKRWKPAFGKPRTKRGGSTPTGSRIFSTRALTYIHGGSIRNSGKARYRQWMTHKLASWIDQFGTSGCVGCGRCITWCPVGIDITEEACAIREGEQNGEP